MLGTQHRGEFVAFLALRLCEVSGETHPQAMRLVILHSGMQPQELAVTVPAFTGMPSTQPSHTPIQHHPPSVADQTDNHQHQPATDPWGVTPPGA